VIDLAKRFGMVRERTDGVQAVIVEAAGQEVGVMVDEVTEVLRIEDSAIDPAQTVCHAGEFLRGIGKLEGRLLIILDLDKLFSEEEHGMIQAAV